MTNTVIGIRPIKTEEDYDAAVKRIEKLMNAAPESPEEDELDMLATLVCAYEEKHFPMDPPEPVAAIQFRMEQQGLTRKDLEPMGWRQRCGAERGCRRCCRGSGG
jgi:HTH-type transcriptional regulator/antitoxin HigA